MRRLRAAGGVEWQIQETDLGEWEFVKEGMHAGNLDGKPVDSARAL